MDRCRGTRYEIACLPMKHQPEDSTDISAVYSLNENQALDESISEITVVDGPNSKVEVSFLPENLH